MVFYFCDCMVLFFVVKVFLLIFVMIFVFLYLNVGINIVRKCFVIRLYSFFFLLFKLLRMSGFLVGIIVWWFDIFVLLIYFLWDLMLCFLIWLIYWVYGFIFMFFRWFFNVGMMLLDKNFEFVCGYVISLCCLYSFCNIESVFLVENLKCLWVLC